MSFKKGLANNFLLGDVAKMAAARWESCSKIRWKGRDKGG